MRKEEQKQEELEERERIKREKERHQQLENQYLRMINRDEERKSNYPDEMIYGLPPRRAEGNDPYEVRDTREEKKILEEIARREYTQHQGYGTYEDTVIDDLRGQFRDLREQHRQDRELRRLYQPRYQSRYDDEYMPVGGVKYY